MEVMITHMPNCPPQHFAGGPGFAIDFNFEGFAAQSGQGMQHCLVNLVQALEHVVAGSSQFKRRKR